MSAASLAICKYCGQPKKTCFGCKQLKLKALGIHWRTSLTKILEFCVECQAHGFHRLTCPNLDSRSITEAECEIGCNRVVASIERRLAALSVPQRFDKPRTDVGEKTTRPVAVEDGGTRDEGVPESGLGWIDFPGLPTNLNHP